MKWSCLTDTQDQGYTPRPEGPSRLWPHVRGLQGARRTTCVHVGGCFHVGRQRQDPQLSRAGPQSLGCCSLPFTNREHHVGHPRATLPMEWLLGNSAQMAERGTGGRQGVGGAHGSVQCRPSTWGTTLGVPSPRSYRQRRGGPLSPCPYLRQVTDHMEYRINLEMQRTICLKMEENNCSFQEGELYKVLVTSPRKSLFLSALLLCRWKNDEAVGGSRGRSQGG